MILLCVTTMMMYMFNTKFIRFSIDNDCTTVQHGSILSVASAQDRNVAQRVKHRDLCYVKQAGEAI